jgi:hypothetical protein
MPLPVGSWNISTDTLGPGTLTLASVDATGNVAGSITTGQISGAIVGFFDATSQTANLSNVANPAQTFVVFSAPLFQVSSSSKTQTTTDSILAGTYEVYPPPGVAASTGRWVAALNQKVKEKDKEEKEKEVSKDSKDIKDHKESTHDKIQTEKQLPDLPQVSTAGDVAGTLQTLTLRLDALEQRLATGQAFIAAEERPEVGDQALRDTGQ